MAATHAVAAAFALALLAMILGPHRVGDAFTETDFYGAYGPQARALLHGRFDPAQYAVVGPVFIVVLALAGAIARDFFVAAELISLLSATFALVLWARVIRARTSAAHGLFAALLLACNASWFRYGYAATTDALALVLETGAIALLFTGRGTPRRVLAAGAVAGLAFLTRYSAVALLPFGIVALLAGWSDTSAADTAGSGTPRRRGTLLFVAGFLAPVVPWIAISLASGAHFAFQLHHNLAYDVFARAKGIPWDTYQRDLQSQFPTPWSVWNRDPAAVTARLVANVGDHLRLDGTLLAGLPVAIAAVAGALFARRDGTLARLAPLGLFAALFFVTLVPVFHSERYSLPMLPVWAAFAAAAFASPVLAVPVAGGRVWLKSLLVAVPLLLSLRTSLAVQRRVLSQLPLEVLEVARAAKPYLKPGDRVLARKPHFAWHAGLEPVPFAFADSLGPLADAARRAGARWLYFSWPEAEMRPQFAWLLDTTSHVPGLTVRATSSGHPAVLYEIGPGFGAAPGWLGDPAEVAVHRARAQASINGTDWKSRVIVAIAERRLQHWAAAQPLLEQAARLAPNEFEVQLLLADNLLHAGTPGSAEDAFTRAGQLSPGDPRVQLGLGWAALLDHRTARAAELWKPVVLEADDAATVQRMVELFTATGDAEALATAKAHQRDLGFAR